MRLLPMTFVPTRRLWCNIERQKPRFVRGGWAIRVVGKGIYLDWRDLWIGIYWNRITEEVNLGRYFGEFEVYICILPALPVHIIFQVYGPHGSAE
jgi:hypothetical protein